MYFSTVLSVVILAQAPVSVPAPRYSAAVEAHLQCMALAASMGGTETDEQMRMGSVAAIGYYYGRIDAIAPSTNIADGLTRFLRQPDVISAQAERCGKEMMAIGRRMQADGRAVSVAEPAK